MDLRNEMTADEKRRAFGLLVEALPGLVEGERYARETGNERQLRGCLDGQRRVMARLRNLGFFGA